MTIVAAEPPKLSTPWWSAEREALQAQARAFARDEVWPAANEFDPVKGLIPPRLIDRLGELGYFGITIPQEHGGLGLGVIEYCIVAEELARSWMSVASILARAQGLGTDVADPDRRARLLAKSAAGRWIGSVGFSEPDAGSDLASVTTTAVRDGDEWVITGEKRWTGNALAADFIQVLCRGGQPVKGRSNASGLMTLLIEKERGVFPDGITGTPIDKIGYHGFQTWNLHLDGVRVPVSNALGRKSQAFAETQRFLNIARVHTAARAVGLARGALEDSIAYLQQRRQFGAPLSDFQALRFELADMAAQVNQARTYYLAVAHAIDSGDGAEADAAMVKLLATEMSVRVTNSAMQLFGGNGYTTEHQVERYWRDARLTTIFEGTSEIQKRTISNRLLGRQERRG